MEQLHNLAALPFVFKHIAVMPDCHLGMGATVGSVIATRGAIVPAAVGVDIGCGMIAVKTSMKADNLPDNLVAIRAGIERRVPVGFSVNNKITDSAAASITKLSAHSDVDHYDAVDKRWPHALGSLGGGNHFIEICLDQDDTVWVVLHSGSRGIGNKLAQQHIKIARELMDRWFILLNDKDLAYLPTGTPEFESYIRDLLWAQRFAHLNREEIMDRVMTELSYAFFDEGGYEDNIEVERINCHHNFTQQENHMGKNVWVTRKGAIQMQAKQRGVIPGSMGTRSYIVSGLGNPLSFESAPHGAGRRFSRTEARRRFTMEDFDREMAGIECKRSEQLIDELPGAYKDIDQVMENSKELVSIEYTLKQILNVKGD
jgi:tRNA-splicing ligase RtcB